METDSDFRRWDELIPDALGLIFCNLSLQEVLTVIPRVCKAWNRTVAGPYCWQEIDIEEWSIRHKPECVDRMLRMLITGSCGSFHKLCVSGLSDDIHTFSFIAENAGSLKTLRLPRSDVSDSVVESIAGKLSTVTSLDLSYCRNITASAIEVIGKNCKSLAVLCRNLHPLDMDGRSSEDAEVRAIAATMPKLKRLELAYHLISTESVMEVILSCTDLELLDLRGCWDVNLDEKLLKEKFPKLKVLGPLVTDHFERDGWDDCSDYSDDSDYLEWDLDDMDYYDEFWGDHGGMEQVELRFYERGGYAGIHGWPPSP